MKIIIIVAVIFIIYKVITKHRSSTPSNSNSIQSAIPRQPIKRSNPHRILICDDAAFMRMMLKDILTKDGYEVVAEAQNGLEAIERYSEFKPDLVFMDITMPIMDGIDAIRKIKEMDRRANIVVCSAMGEQKQVEEAIYAGAKDFIVKPFDKERILKTVVEIFEPSRTVTPPSEKKQSKIVNHTPPTQPQNKQNQTVSTTPPVQTQSNRIETLIVINDYESYGKALKQYYSQYGDEVFLTSRLLGFISSNQLDSRFNIQADDVAEDFRQIRVGRPPQSLAKWSQGGYNTSLIQTQNSPTENINTILPKEIQSKQNQTTSTTPPVQTKNKQNQSTDNSPTVRYPFDLNYAPELCFFTNTSLSDKFPKTAGQGEMIIRYPVINVDVNIVEFAIIVDDCLIQFSEDGKMHVLNIPDNTAYAYEISGRNAHQDLLKWVKETVLAVAPKQINAVKKNPGAMQWLQLYSTILFYYTTNKIGKEKYNTAMQTLRQGFRLAPNDETIRIVNRQWYYNEERKTWGNIALNIFRDYFKEFSTYH